MNGSTPRDLTVEPVLASPGTGALGPPVPGGFVAPSLAALVDVLSSTLGVPVQIETEDVGIATYVAACMGVKPSGGYAVDIRSARLDGDRVTVRLALREPGPDDFTSQALSSPFALAVIRDLRPEGKTFSFEADLSWPVVDVGG
jgi:hypothetical protein